MHVYLICILCNIFMNQSGIPATVPVVVASLLKLLIAVLSALQ